MGSSLCFTTNISIYNSSNTHAMLNTYNVNSSIIYITISINISVVQPESPYWALFEQEVNYYLVGPFMLEDGSATEHYLR